MLRLRLSMGELLSGTSRFARFVGCLPSYTSEHVRLGPQSFSIRHVCDHEAPVSIMKWVPHSLAFFRC